MSDQTIPNTGGDVIKNVDPSQWNQTSNCPSWVVMYTAEYTEEYT